MLKRLAILVLAGVGLAGVAAKPADAQVRLGVYLGGPRVVQVPVAPRYVAPYYNPYYDPYYRPYYGYPRAYRYQYTVPQPYYFVAPRYRYERRVWRR